MTTTFHRHWRDVPDSVWRWPNFSPAQIACRGTGKRLINEPALDRLQALRDRLGKPLIVRSAYRSPEHNRAVGRAAPGVVLAGRAPDASHAGCRRGHQARACRCWRRPGRGGGAGLPVTALVLPWRPPARPGGAPKGDAHAHVPWRCA